MKLTNAFTFAAAVLAAAIPFDALAPIETLQVRSEPSFGDKFLSGINMNELSENVRKVLSAGRKFEKFRRASKVDVVSYYCSATPEQQTKLVTKSQEMFLKKFQSILADAGLDVRDVFCPGHAKRDNLGRQTTQEPYFFFGIPKNYWKNLEQLLRRV